MLAVRPPVLRDPGYTVCFVPSLPVSMPVVREEVAMTLEPQYTVVDCGHDTPCWRYNGALTSTGYAGRVRYQGQRMSAYRAAFLAAGGVVGDGEQLDHLCRVRSCVRPDHLEAVTPRENARRSTLTPLTHGDVRELRARFDAYMFAHPLNARGHKRKRLQQGVLAPWAKEYGVSKATVASVLRGRTWA